MAHQSFYHFSPLVKSDSPWHGYPDGPTFLEKLSRKRSMTEKQPMKLPLPLPRDDYRVPLHRLVPLVSPRTRSLGGWLGAMSLYL